MRVRFKQCLAGSNFCHNPGDVCDFGDDKAARLIEAGIAEPIKSAAKLETATAAELSLETATLPDLAPPDVTPKAK